MPHRQDKTQFPIVIDFMVGDSTTEGIHDFLNAHDALLAEKRPYAVLVDAREAKTMEANHRRLIGDWIKSRREELAKYRVAMAFLSDSRLVRGVLTAIYWLSPPPYPYKTFGDPDLAKQWLNEQLAKKR